MSIRYYGVLPFAALATGGLFSLMTLLIRTQWVPQDTNEDLKFNIYPVVEPYELIRTNLKLKPLERVETPPAPPIIETQAAQRPTEPLAGYDDMIGSFDPPKISMAPLAINIIDSRETALVRVPPAMPSRADRSGHCIARFNINAEGTPYNISTPFCSESIFSRPTIQAVQRWKYRPAIQNGTARSSRSIETRVSFNLKDEKGRIIAE